VAQLDAELLRTLATYRAVGPTAITCYLDLDPATVPTARDVQSHVTSLLDAARRASEEISTDHDSTTQLRSDLERVESYLVTDFDRAGAHALALFVSGEDDRWSEVRLPAPVREAAHVGRTFVTAPLLEFAETDRELVVVAVGRDRGQIWRLRHGAFSALEDSSRDGQGQHDQGGWSQARYQRSRDREAVEHMRRVAEAISRHIRPGSGTLLVVACTRELRDAFQLFLDAHVKQVLIGFTEIEKQSDSEDLRPAVEQLLEARLDTERATLVAAWREELGQRSGLAAGTWDEVLSAAWDGRVGTLLADGRTAVAYECGSCGRGFLGPGRCSLDSTPLEEALGGALEVALRGTLAHDGAARFVPDDTLEDTAGAVALLRYATRPAMQDVSARLP
jgi:peptide chain release factor subunit 1